MPGRTVAFERSITLAPGGMAAEPASPTLSTRFPRTTIAWLRLVSPERGSIRFPARITVMDELGVVAGAIWAKADWPRLIPTVRTNAMSLQFMGVHCNRPG